MKRKKRRNTVDSAKNTNCPVVSGFSVSVKNGKNKKNGENKK